MRTYLLLPACLFLFLACDPSLFPVGPGDGGRDGSDGGLEEEGDGATGPWDLDGIDYAISNGEPVDAPLETWTFVPVDEAKCTNGTSTGFAINRTDRSDRLVILLAGGGACWEAAACAAGFAVHIQDTMGEGPVLAEARSAGLRSVFDREDADNPFRDASFVYIPYCTGDLHSGTRVHTYDWFGPRELHHVGGNNMHHYLRRIRATFPEVDRVWLSGVSAGGYGATTNWWRVQKAMPWARVDVFNDSGLPIDVAGDGRWGTMLRVWAPAFPPGCDDCDEGLSRTLEYSAEILAEPRRYGVIGFLEDDVIAAFFGLTTQEVQARMESMRDAAAPNVKTFLLSGTGHVVYDAPSRSTTDGVSARSWATEFAEDAASWEHVGP